MRLLTLSQVRYLRFAPWSTLTVLLGVALAVSSIVAVHQISRQVEDNLGAATPAYLHDVAYLIDRPGLRMQDYFELRERWRRGELPALKALMPLVRGVTVSDRRTFSLVGVDAFSGVASVAGMALVPPGEIVLGTTAAVAEGGSVRLNGAVHRVAFLNDAVPDGVVITDIGTAQVLLGRDDESLDRIAVVVNPSARRLERWGGRLLPGLSAGVRLPVWSLPGWRVEPVDVELPDLAFARSVLFNLGALGSLALVVAWLLVYQVGVIWLRRRALTLTRLQQMGVSDAELRRGFILNLSALGALAAGLGMLAGELLAMGLSQAVTGYGDLQGSVPPLDSWVVGKAMASALLVCLVGGWAAFRRERYPSTPHTRWLVPLAVLGVGAFGLVGTQSLLGGFAAIAAVALLPLLGIVPLLRVLARFSGRIGGGLLVRSGVRELVAYPGDLAVAIGALVLALATSVAVAAMVDSFRSDFERMLDQRLAYDLFVDGHGQDLTAVADVIGGWPGVSRVQRYGAQEVHRLGRRLAVGFSRFDERESRRYGLDAPLAAGQCIVSERLARDMGLETGDVIDELHLTVAGTFPGFGDAVPRLLLGEEDAVRLGIQLRYDRLGVAAASPDAIARRLLAEAPGATVQAHGVVRNRALAIFDQTFTLTGALTLLALGVAGVGLYNALLALTLLRQPTRRLFDAMGVSAAEQRRVDVGRTLGVCALVLLLALPLGLVMGVLLCQVINPRAFGWSLAFAPGAAALLRPTAIALGMSLLVSLLPVPAEEIPDAE